MEYNDTVIFSQKGFHIDKNLMLPIGVQSGYRLWGVYETGNKDCNLIVSALPHASWGGLLRLRLRLQAGSNIEYTIREISSVFEGLAEPSAKNTHITILSLNTSISTDSHHVISMIIELPNFRNDENEGKCRKDDFDCFEEKYQERYGKLYNLAKKASEEIKRNLAADLYKREGFNGVDVKLIKSLLKESICLEPDLIRFEYDTKEMLLFPESKIDKDRLLERVLCGENSKIGIDFSLSMDKGNDRVISKQLLYLTVFDPLNKIIRLQNIREDTLYKIDMDYAYKCKDEKTVAAQAKKECYTCGFLESIVLEKNEVVISAKKMTTRYSDVDERGRLSVLMKVSGAHGGMLAEEIKSRFDGDKKFFGEKDNLKTNVRVRQMSQHKNKVFISLRQCLKSERWEFIEDALWEYGLEAISTKDNNNITDKVVQDMKDSSACIQIYSICRDSERMLKEYGRKVSLDVLESSWLLFEWGVARSLEYLPVVRMLDVTHVAKHEWERHLRIDRDSPLETFQTYSASDADDHFNAVFKKVAKEVALKIYRSSSSI